MFCGPKVAKQKSEHLGRCVSTHDTLYLIELPDDQARDLWVKRHSQAATRARSKGIKGGDRVAIPVKGGGFLGITVRRDKAGRAVSTDEVRRLFDHFVSWRIQERCNRKLQFAGDHWSVGSSSITRGKGGIRGTPDILKQLERTLRRRLDFDQARAAVEAAGGKLIKRGAAWRLSGIELSKLPLLVFRLGAGHDPLVHAEWVELTAGSGPDSGLVVLPNEPHEWSPIDLPFRNMWEEWLCPPADLGDVNSAAPPESSQAPTSGGYGASPLFEINLDAMEEQACVERSSASTEGASQREPVGPTEPTVPEGTQGEDSLRKSEYGAIQGLLFEDTKFEHFNLEPSPGKRDRTGESDEALGDRSETTPMFPEYSLCGREGCSKNVPDWKRKTASFCSQSCKGKHDRQLKREGLR